MLLRGEPERGSEFIIVWDVDLGFKSTRRRGQGLKMWDDSVDEGPLSSRNVGIIMVEVSMIERFWSLHG